jgi:UDP-N-acetylglucosamine/UDP-N-acetylgalactosamine diphosphorylase
MFAAEKCQALFHIFLEIFKKTRTIPPLQHGIADMNEKIMHQQLKARLEKHNQTHLLDFWQSLDPAQKQALIEQINDIDFHAIDQWVENIIKKPVPLVIPPQLQPAIAYPPSPSGPQQCREYSQAIRLGKKLIAEGQVAAFVVAGGQGTRLGFDGPKGDFPISPIKNKTLFQIFGQTIAAVSKKYNAKCPWYIMTSPLNNQQTLDSFRRNNYFGLDPGNVFIFQQGTNPNFDFDGRILLAGKADIARSPDGHGGSLKALYKSGAITDMKKRGVKFISYFQVDNPLVNIFDPLFIGLHTLANAQMSSKALPKREPKEKIGVFCLVNGAVTVLEYSDLPDELAEKRKPDRSLAFGLGSIAIHIINVDFVEKLNAKGFSLPLHRAVKKIPYIDRNGNPVNPDKPNGIKLETFVFDALPLAERSIILETVREQEFAPVKDAHGADSPETTMKIMVARAADWLKAAGIPVPKKPDGSLDCLLEIAPGFAFDKEDIKDKRDQIPPIKPGDSIYLA